MNRKSWILLIIAVLLIVWGIADFYNYAVTGRELLQYYGEAELINRLVSYSFAQGVIKVILALLLIPIFHFVGKKRK